MALTKEIEYQYEITAKGDIQERERTLIYEDGKLISTANHRRVIEVDADVTNESADIQAIMAQFSTPERRSARSDQRAEQAQANGPSE